MEELSFFEKLGVLFQNLLAHPFFVCLLLLPVLVIFFNKKITKKAVVLIYIAVLAVVLFIGNVTIFSLFDNLMDNLFMALYFPNFITLFLVEVLSAIICLITFLKKDITKISKIINFTGFAIIQMLFALILTVIQANEIDIYKENALYASNDVLTLMQLLMGTFALQIISLVVVKAIDRVTAKLDGTDLNKHTVRLPSGRITHAKLGEKVVIKEPKVVVKEPEVIIKEPEVKLDPTKPVTPINKSLIKEEKISPIDVEAEIKKEKSKPKPTIKKETSEILSDIKPKVKEEIKVEEKPVDVKIEPAEPIKPLDKSLIKEEKISPINIEEEIKKEQPKPTIKKDTDEILADIKPKTEDKPVVEEKQEPEINKANQFKEKALQGFGLFTTKVKDNISKLSNNIKQNIDAAKMKKIQEQKPETKLETERPKEEVNIMEPVVPKKDSKFVNKEVLKPKPDLLKPMEPEPQVIKEQQSTKTNEEKELITNLQIINFEKTVKAIKNLSTVYTL